MIIVHILHKDDRPDHKVKLLCGAEGMFWTYKQPGGAWISEKPTCPTCLLLAMAEPENVFGTR